MEVKREEIEQKKVKSRKKNATILNVQNDNLESEPKTSTKRSKSKTTKTTGAKQQGDGLDQKKSSEIIKPAKTKKSTATKSTNSKKTKSTKSSVAKSIGTKKQNKSINKEASQNKEKIVPNDEIEQVDEIILPKDESIQVAENDKTNQNDEVILPNDKKNKKQKIEQKHDKKQQKTKKIKIKPKYLALLGVILSFFALIGFGAGIIAWWVSVNVPMDTPNINICALDGKTYIIADYNSKATGYEFSLKESESEAENIVFSKTNMIEVAKYLNRPTDFELRVRTIGEINGANSKWSEVLFYSYKMRLDTPQLVEIKDGDNTLLSWKPVQYAESYRVYYSNGKGEIKGFVVTGNSSNNIIVNFTNRTEILPDKYQVYVVAMATSGNNYISQSFASNIVEISKYSKLPNVQILQNDKYSYTLKYYKNSINYVKKFKFLINNCEFYINSDIIINNGIVDGFFYKYDFDISGIYNELTYGNPSICKASAISLNEFIRDSEEVVISFDE